MALRRPNSRGAVSGRVILVAGDKTSVPTQRNPLENARWVAKHPTKTSWIPNSLGIFGGFLVKYHHPDMVNGVVFVLEKLKVVHNHWFDKKFWCLTIQDDSYYSWRSTHLVDGTSSSIIPFFHNRFPVVVAECWPTWAFATDMWKSYDRRGGEGKWDGPTWRIILLLMVQKFGLHQLRLVVEIPLFTRF